MPQRILQTVTRLCLLCLWAPLLASQTLQAGDLLIQVDGRLGQASLHMALVPAAQPDWLPSLHELHSTETTLRLVDLPPGRYAAQLFQDTNGNGQLDLSPRGIPLEPVGFSANPAIFGGKPPPLASQFQHGEADTAISIRLQQPRNSPGRAVPGTAAGRDH